jgi:probable rRNA maturation factor
MKSHTVKAGSADLPQRIRVSNRQSKSGLSSERITLFCDAVLNLLGKEAASLSVAFVGAAKMRGINKAYLEHDYATDVLSFSYSRVRIDGYEFLGDIVISAEVAALNARRYRIPLEREIRRLLVHGILHLLGYNHENDRGRMMRLQSNLMRRAVLASFSLLAAGKKSR